MKKKIHFSSLVGTGMMLFSATVMASEEHRELGAHVHGHGTLTIAFDANKVQVELAVPGMDIVGFEHEASTDEQKKVVDMAIADLKQPLNQFSFPEAAGCSVSAAEVNMVTEEHEDHAGGEHKHGEAEEVEEHHTEIRATYSLTCTNPAEVKSVGFPFFDRFTGSEELDVTIIDASGQASFEVSRDAPRLDR